MGQKRWAMVIILSVCLGLSACQSNDAAVPLEIMEETETAEVIESRANEEYDSLETFLEVNDESVFALNTPQASDTNVSVSKSYIAVTYECESGNDAFQVRLYTYTLADGKRQLQSVLGYNPGIAAEEENGGIQMYYCLGTTYEGFNCYAMILDDKMLVVNIEKEYDEYIGDTVRNIVLRQPII